MQTVEHMTVLDTLADGEEQFVTIVEWTQDALKELVNKAITEKRVAEVLGELIAAGYLRVFEMRGNAIVPVRATPCISTDSIRQEINWYQMTESGRVEWNKWNPPELPSVRTPDDTPL